MREIRRLTQMASGASIPVIHLKGALLATDVYGDEGLRQPGDMDMLVSRGDVLKMLQILRKDGYKPTVIETRSKANWSTIERPEVLEFGTELTLKKPNRVVDLHWGLMKNSLLSIPAEEIWDSVVKVNVGGQDLLTLAPALNFIFLARHAAKHGWQRYRWIADLIFLIQSQDFDFDELLSLSRKYRYEKFALFALSLVSNAAGLSLPDHVQNLLDEDATIEIQAGDLLDVIFKYGRFNEIESVIRMSRLEGDRLCATRMMVDALLAPTLRDWERFQLPSQWCPLLKILRPLRLLADYARLFPSTIGKAVRNQTSLGRI